MLWLDVSCVGNLDDYQEEFLKEEGSYFVIGGGKCSCNRDLTLSEFKEILKSLRESEKLEIEKIWEPKYSSGKAPNDTSIENTLKELISVFKKFKINKCIRKVYFMQSVTMKRIGFTPLKNMTTLILLVMIL